MPGNAQAKHSLLFTRQDALKTMIKAAPKKKKKNNDKSEFTLNGGSRFCNVK